MAADPTELVTALWVGSHDAELPERITLRSGKDTFRVTRGEAETSDNWQLVEPDKPKAAAAVKTTEKSAD